LVTIEHWQHHFNARWYDADTARFVSEDPARDGVSWFAYVKNNPMRYIDPTGLRRVDGDEVDSREDRNQRDNEFEEKKQRASFRKVIENQLQIFDLLIEHQLNEEIIDILLNQNSADWEWLGYTEVFGEDRLASLGAQSILQYSDLKHQVVLEVSGYYYDPESRLSERSVLISGIDEPEITIYLGSGGSIVKSTISGEQNIVDNIGFQWSNRGGSKERFVLTVGGSLHFIFDIPEDQSFIAATFRGLLTRSDGQQREIEIGVVAVDE
jgi:hypothetical protein